MSFLHIKQNKMEEQTWGIPRNSTTVFKNIYIGSLIYSHIDKRPTCSLCQAKADIKENKIYFCASCKCKMEGIT